MRKIISLVLMVVILSLNISTMVFAVMTTVASFEGESANDLLGYSVAISEDGTTAVVGARNASGIEATAGAAYIYTLSGGTWTFNQKIVASDGATDDKFGISVSINANGSYIIVGAFGNQENGNYAGAAYVYAKSGETWTEQEKLLASDGFAGDNFGYSVTIDGNANYALIGARGDDNNGSVYVFARSGVTWSQITKLTASDGAATDFFGQSVVIDGAYAIIGAPQDDDGGSNSGSAYVFYNDGGIWGEQDKLVPADGAPDDAFGESVAISGNVALIGAYKDDDGGTDSGSAYVFERVGVSWSETDKIVASDDDVEDYFGFSLDFSPNGLMAVIGAYGDGDVGATYVFDVTTWSQTEKIVADGLSSGSNFGYSVATLNNAEPILVGATSYNSVGGAFFIEDVPSTPAVPEFSTYMMILTLVVGFGFLYKERFSDFVGGEVR